MIRNIFILLLFPLLIHAQTAFISADERICDNTGYAKVKINFLGNSPFTFVYAIDGVEQPSIISQDAMYCILTKKEGIYTLKSFSDAFNQGSMNGSGIVSVMKSPIAIIHLLVDTLSVLYPQADFVSQSIGSIVEQRWNFGDNTGDFIAYNPHHTFPVDQFGIGVSGMYESSLIITDDMGCMDTAKNHVWVREESYMYVPNSFTPDGDNKNDRFCIEYNAIREQTFLFKVYNSLGELMYQTTNSEDLNCNFKVGWDGKKYKTKNDLPSDTYIYEIYYQDFEGWKHQDYGSIILIR